METSFTCRTAVERGHHRKQSLLTFLSPVNRSWKCFTKHFRWNSTIFPKLKYFIVQCEVVLSAFHFRETIATMYTSFRVGLYLPHSGVYIFNLIRREVSKILGTGTQYRLQYDTIPRVTRLIKNFPIFCATSCVLEISPLSDWNRKRIHTPFKHSSKCYCGNFSKRIFATIMQLT